MIKSETSTNHIGVIENLKKVLIIGGGASGLIAAIAAAEQGAKVTLLEKNKQTGKKLLVTGNGRCNFTNKDQKLEHYRSETPEFVREASLLWRE